jgi:hypothetical protein
MGVKVGVAVGVWEGGSVGDRLAVLVRLGERDVAVAEGSGEGLGVRETGSAGDGEAECVGEMAQLVRSRRKIDNQDDRHSCEWLECIGRYYSTICRCSGHTARRLRLKERMRNGKTFFSK